MATPSDPPLLGDLDDPYLDPWADYIGGQWVLSKPQRAGIYPIASREGHHVGYREFKMRDGELVDTLVAVNEPGWCGWYWSVPLPSPPREVPN